MTRRSSALAWGAVGALAFLVLARGYRLVLGGLAGFPTLLAVAAAVGCASAAGAYVAEPRLKRRG